MQIRQYAALLVAGVAALIVATFLHPSHEDPGDAVKAFAEYAADPNWLMSHLLQLAGAVCMVLGLAGTLQCVGARSDLRPICMVLSGAAIAILCALQAVDGVALKFMVDRLAVAAPEDKNIYFQAAFAVRAIEIGLAAIATMLIGLTVIVYSFAFHRSGLGGRVLLAIGFLTGLLSLGAGWGTGFMGFGGWAMMAGMASRILLMGWVVAVAIIVWRRDALTSDQR
jgi:hypothetical protein